MTLEIKQKTITEQEKNLFELHKNLNAELKAQNETQMKLNQLFLNFTKQKQELDMRKVNETILQRKLNQSKSEAESLQK